MRIVPTLVAAAVTAAAGTVTLPAPASHAAPSWAPAATARIHPGVQTFTDGAQCTANFVFYDATHVYVGQAAHCSGTGGSTETNGCTSGSLPLGTRVTVNGASRTGVMVYNSWLAMQARGETDPSTCQYNDFALVRLAAADRARVNPTVPHWGGPIGIDRSGLAFGETVYSYGNSSLRAGVTVLSPKTGRSIGDTGGGWSHEVYTVTPGIPGDSGSAFLDRNGRAIGVLSTVQLAPLAGANGVGDLAKELAYAQQQLPALRLALGTEAFDPSAPPVGV
jgi:hypothetical protein